MTSGGRCNGPVAAIVRLSPYRPTWTAAASASNRRARKDGSGGCSRSGHGTGEPACCREPETAVSERVVSGRPASLTRSSDRRPAGISTAAGGRRTTARGRRRCSPPRSIHESTAAISLDGRWMASDRRDRRRVQVYVRSWPTAPTRSRPPRAAGGCHMGPNGELYYWQTGENMLRVIRTRETGGQLSISPAQPAWKADVASAVLRRVVITTPNARFDVDPGGALPRAREGEPRRPRAAGADRRVRLERERERPSLYAPRRGRDDASCRIGRRPDVARAAELAADDVGALRDGAGLVEGDLAIAALPAEAAVARHDETLAGWISAPRGSRRRVLRPIRLQRAVADGADGDLLLRCA